MSKPRNSRQNLRCCRPDGTRFARSLTVLEQRERILADRRRESVHLLDEVTASRCPRSRNLLALLWINHVVVLDEERLRTRSANSLDHRVQCGNRLNTPLVERAALCGLRHDASFRLLMGDGSYAGSRTTLAVSDVGPSAKEHVTD
jgi:hypothetical protein